MKILVTGCNGYIGSHLVKQLSEKGYQVDGLDYKKGNNINHYTKQIWHTDITSNFSEELLAVKWDVVCHLAALTRVAHSVEFPTSYYETNWRGTVNLLKKLHYKHFIFASTGATEDNSSPYAKSKAIAENSIREISKNYTIFRFFNVVGEGEFKITNPDSLMAKLKEAAKTGEFIIYGADYPNTKDGTCVRDYCHVEDIAAAILKAVESPPANSPYECLGYGQSTTVREFVNAYRKINQLDFKVKIENRRTGDKEISEVPFVSHYMKQNYSLEQLVLEKILSKKEVG